MIQSPSSSYQPALTALHAEKPLRVWSLIVTVFGDLIMERGMKADPPTMWIAPLLDLLELLGIDGALARTNFSRLVANGTLLRTKSSRNTFYRLSDSSRAQFMTAAQRIYGRDGAAPATHLTLTVIDRCKDRGKARAALLEAGFTMIAPTVGLAPRTIAPESLPPETIITAAIPSIALRQAAAEAWHIEELSQAYHRFIRNYASLDSAVSLSPSEAVSARIAMVHQYRRLVLRDPHLTPELLPQGWAGQEARALFTRACQKLDAGSARWLEDTGFYRQPDA